MPTARAGADQHLMSAGPVASTVLDGSASRDLDGVIVLHRWQQVSGPSAATIVTPTQARTPVTGLRPGAYEFELTVTDNAGEVARDSVRITVREQPNLAPVANAGGDRQLTLPSAVATTVSAVLDGSASFDPDGTLVAFTWRQVAGPSGAVIATPNLAQSLVSGLGLGQHEFSLTVTDARGTSASDSVRIEVLAPAAPAEPVGPLARAGRDLVLVLPVNAVTLDGSSSSAADGTPLRFYWEQTAGPAAGCASGHDAARLALTRLVAGTYRFRLTVTDTARLSDSDEIVVTVRRAVTLSPA